MGCEVVENPSFHLCATSHLQSASFCLGLAACLSGRGRAGATFSLSRSSLLLGLRLDACFCGASFRAKLSVLPLLLASHSAHATPKGDCSQTDQRSHEKERKRLQIPYEFLAVLDDLAAWGRQIADFRA